MRLVLAGRIRFYYIFVNVVVVCGRWRVAWRDSPSSWWATSVTRSPGPGRSPPRPGRPSRYMPDIEPFTYQREKRNRRRKDDMSAKFKRRMPRKSCREDQQILWCHCWGTELKKKESGTRVFYTFSFHQVCFPTAVWAELKQHEELKDKYRNFYLYLFYFKLSFTSLVTYWRKLFVSLWKLLKSLWFFLSLSAYWQN